MMVLIIEALAAVLGAGPAPVLPAARIGSRRPAAPSDLPAVVIALTLDSARERWPRDPERDRYRGALTVDIWAATAAEAETVARKLQQRLHDGSVDLRGRGFAFCAPSGLEPLEDLRQQPASGSAFSAYRQRMTFRFAFESTLAAAESEGGPIRRIDVALGPPTDEQMRIT